MASLQTLPAPRPTPLRLLSLDGGGVRGLSSLIILKYLMKRLNPCSPPKPCEYFDLIGGTSTGGLIAIMLGRLEMDVDSSINAYLNLSSVAFQRRRNNFNIFGNGSDIYHVKGTYSSEGLELVVKDLVRSVEGNSEAQFVSPTRCKSFVCTFTKSGNTPVLIRTYTHDTAVESLSTSGCTIWQAARATSAAALFFDPIRIGRQQYVDGATGLNNPVESVLEEAMSIWPDAMARIQCILSVGTGEPEMKDFGNNLKEVIDTLKDISTETENTAKRFLKNSKQIGLGDRYFRFNVNNGLRTVDLDEHKKADKIESATEAYLVDPRIDTQIDSFVNARAPNVLPPLTRDAKNNLLQWLKCVDTSKLHNYTRQKKTRGTGAWFIEDQFDDWKVTSHSFLWIYGKAGSGKSVLCSNIIDQVEHQRLGALSYFYFTFRRTERQDLRTLLHSLLAQLVRNLTRENERHPQQYDVPKPFRELYEKYVLESEPKIEDLQDVFLAVLAESPATYIIIDALDECPLIKDRNIILSFLAEVSSSTSCGTHILVTSRREEDIENTINDISFKAKITTVPIQNSDVDDDIRRHVDACLVNDSQFKRWGEALKTKVINDLASKSNGVFRWAECQLASLSTKIREKDVLIAMEQLPKDLDDTYARMLALVDSKGYGKEAHSVLQWLAFSSRPLTLAEAAEVVVFDQRDASSNTTTYAVSFDQTNRFPTPMDVQNILSQLVVVSENGQMTFSHFSVKEYLVCERVEPFFKIEEHLAHRFIFESCLVYIEEYFNSSIDPLDSGNWDSLPILHYACQYWPDHARATFSARVQTSYTDELACGFFEKNPLLFVSSLKISGSVLNGGHQLFHSKTIYTSPAWFLTNHNLEYIMRLLWDRNEKIELGVQVPFNGNVALHVAAQKGYDRTASLLLDREADIEVKDQNGQTALYLASSNGHANLVHLLLNRGACITTRNVDERTSLHIAAIKGHEGVVQILASRMRKDDLEIRDLYGLTALHLTVRFAEWQSASGASMVKKLLEIGASANASSTSGKTAAEEAIDYSQKQIFSLLKSYGGPQNIPFRQPSNNRYFDEAWKTLRAVISRFVWMRWNQRDIQNHIQTRIATHTALYKYCATPRDGWYSTSLGSWIVEGYRDSDLIGKEVYIAIDNHIRNMLVEIQQVIARQNQDALLSVYIREWSHYCKAAEFLSPMFRYLDRHWIRRELDEGREVYLVHDLLLRLWRLNIVDQNPQIISTVLVHFERLRNGEAVDMSKAKAVLDSFQVMSTEVKGLGGLNTYHYELEKGLERLDVYQDYFEKLFLKATRDYYQKKLEQVSESTEEYDELIKLYNIKERGYSSKFLHPSTEEKMSTILDSIKSKK